MKSESERDAYRQRFIGIDFRQHPEQYRIGRGEEGVLLVEPYKSEILPHWRFKTAEIAEASAAKIYQMFLRYLSEEDFVGADMARKFLQMGYTRAKRYANHRSGKKYAGKVPKELRGISGAHGRAELPKDLDAEKLKAAECFLLYYRRARQNEQYRNWVQEHRQRSR